MKKLSLFLLSLCLTVLVNAQTGTVKGKITTTDGKTAGGVNVTIKGTEKGTVSNDDGTFIIKNIQPGSYALIVSFTGLSSVEKAISISSDKTTSVDFSLSETSSELDEVIVEAGRSLNRKPVSAGKVAIAPMDLPQSISVIDASLMKDQQVLRLSDVVRNVNGVYLSTTRGSTQESFGARGYNLGSYSMFKNGSRLNTGSMPEMSSLEKVEVLKGSSAILYGNVAPGAVVNMVTKQPKFKFGGEASMRFGSYGLYKPTVDVYGPISKKLAYRAIGTYEKANSYRDVVSSERFYVNPSLLYKPSEKTEILLQADYLKHNFTPDFGIGTLNYSNNGTKGSEIPDVPRSRFMGASWQYAKTQQTTATASINQKLSSNWSLNSSLSYQHYERDYYSTERVQADSNGRFIRPLNKALNEEDYFVGQVNLNGNFKTGKIGHTLLVGIDADHYTTKATTYNNPTTYDTINILDPSKYVQRTDIPAATAIRLTKTPMDRIGAYIQDLISITPKLKLLAGVRWSLQDAKSATVTNLTDNSQTKGAVKTDKAFSPKVGLVYRPLPTTSVFASYSNSFSVNTGTDIYGNALEASIIDQFEAGIKNELLNGKLSLNANVYRIVNNNLAQTAQFDMNGNVNNNTALKELTGQTTSDGVELDVVSHPVNGLDITAGYSYNNMRYTKTENKTGNYVTGQRLVNAPAHTANGSVFYTFTHNKLKGLKLGASVFYIGDRVGGWNNTIGQTQKFSRQIPVDGFTTLDLSAGYSFKGISVLVKVSNVTNTMSYYVHENYSINPIPPTQFGATVSYKF